MLLILIKVSRKAATVLQQTVLAKNPGGDDTLNEHEREREETVP